jgi:hypothetical protein
MLELLMALVLQPQVMKQRFFIPRSEQHLRMEWVQKTLKKRAHSSELFQTVEAALQSQKNCAQFIEPARRQDNLARFHLLGSEKLELDTVKAEQPQTMKPSYFILQSEQQVQMEMVLQHRLCSRFQEGLQVILVRVLNLHLDCILHQEPQVEAVLEVHQIHSLSHSSEQHQALELAHQITRFSIQISEQPKVLVLLPLAIQPLDCTLLQGQLMVLEVAQKVRRHSRRH